MIKTEPFQPALWWKTEKWIKEQINGTRKDWSKKIRLVDLFFCHLTDNRDHELLALEGFDDQYQPENDHDQLDQNGDEPDEGDHADDDRDDGEGQECKNWLHCMESYRLVILLQKKEDDSC